MAWSKRFEDPIALPTGKLLLTLRDAGSYIVALAGKTRQSEVWLTAAEAVLMAAEDRGPLMHARIGMLRALNHGRPAPDKPSRGKRAKLQDSAMKPLVWIYVDTNHQVGHPDHLKVFADPEAADEWFQKNDPEGVAFGYPIIEPQKGEKPG